VEKKLSFLSKFTYGECVFVSHYTPYLCLHCDLCPDSKRTYPSIWIPFLSFVFIITARSLLYENSCLQPAGMNPLTRN
jgi:hypothetical protein